MSRCVQTLRGHTKAVTCVKFDETRVLSGGADCVVRLWDAQKGKQLRSLEAHRGSVAGVDFLGTSAVSCGVDGMRVWDLETGSCLASLMTGLAANAIKMDVTGSRALLACQDGVLRLLDLRGRVGASGSETALLLAGHTDGVTSVQWGRVHERDLVASASADATVRLWDVRGVRAYSVLKPTGYDGPLYAVSMDDSVLAAGGRDRVLHLWDVASEELLRQLKQHHSDTITGVAMGAHQRIFSCSRDKNVRVLRQVRWLGLAAAYSCTFCLTFWGVQDSDPPPGSKRPTSSSVRGGLLRLTEMFSPSGNPPREKDDSGL
jgi:WD40 repeat protein